MIARILSCQCHATFGDSSGYNLPKRNPDSVRNSAPKKTYVVNWDPAMGRLVQWDAVSPAVEAIQRLHSRCCVWDPVFRNAWWLLQRFFWQQYGGFHKWGIPKIVGLFHIPIYFMDDLEVPHIWGNLTKIIILLYPECRCGMFGWFGATVELFFVWERPDSQWIRCGGIVALLPFFRIQKVFCCCLELMSESCLVGPKRHAWITWLCGRWLRLGRIKAVVFRGKIFLICVNS